MTDYDIPELTEEDLSEGKAWTTPEALEEYSSVITDNFEIKENGTTIFGSGNEIDYEIDAGIEGAYGDAVHDVVERANEAGVSVSQELRNLDYTLGIAAARTAVNELQEYHEDGNPIEKGSIVTEAMNDIRSAIEGCEVTYDRSSAHSPQSGNEFWWGLKNFEENFADENDFDVNIGSEWREL